ncbi:P antigen family member 3-like isoform X2 [Hyaena hyaena]|uniref:P antigen family member 3-like isoform X2 n=1 Tax=Hyaena hyaena TaxID=95912 RepID=UPI0019223AD2|nr:P antigen family member 3-like isoform X2 [Hyaena hyaena]
MSGQVTARYKSKEIKGNQEANQPSAPVAVQQPSDEQREEKEAPPERQDIISDKDKAVAEAPMDHGEGPGLEAGIQKLHLNETEGIREDDTDLKGANFASGKPVKMPEAGPDLESGIQKLPLPKNKDISEDDTDAKGADFPTVEPVKMPEAGI